MLCDGHSQYIGRWHRKLKQCSVGTIRNQWFLRTLGKKPLLQISSAHLEVSLLLLQKACSHFICCTHHYINEKLMMSVWQKRIEAGLPVCPFQLRNFRYLEHALAPGLGGVAMQVMRHCCLYWWWSMALFNVRAHMNAAFIVCWSFVNKSTILWALLFPLGVYAYENVVARRSRYPWNQQLRAWDFFYGTVCL